MTFSVYPVQPGNLHPAPLTVLPGAANTASTPIDQLTGPPAIAAPTSR